jgi:xanthine dehydrogenase YagR molybdenum-binding subunit
MDELAVRLGIDPVELRLRNDTDKEPIKGLPYTSRSLARCLTEGANIFGWSHRDPRPGAMRNGAWLVGWGCAAAYYPAKISPSTARVSLMPDGTALVQTAAHDIGTGTYTIIAQTAADVLGLDPGQIAVEIGDSTLPVAGLSAGSSHASAVLNAVALACIDIRDRLARVGPGTLSETIARLGPGPVEAYAEHNPHGAPPDGVRQVQHGQASVTGGSQLKDRIQYSFGAQFAEVRVHERTREIRVPRLVGVFAAGRIVNPRTARSQLMGGMIWGVGAALHEVTEIDPRTARYVNDNLAEYLIPVNADVPSVEVRFLNERDLQVNPLGIKGVGELGIVGVNAAIANAVFHATARRVRELPIRLEALL